MPSRTILAISGALAALSPALAVPIKRAISGAVISSDFPDPAILEVDNTWYAFGTSSLYDNKDINVQLAKSSDFSSWSLLQGQDALPNLPGWVDASKPQVWAPDVVQRDDGKFVLYFSATTNTAGNGAYHCVGTATSASITGPYTPDEDVFACPTDQGGAIDASGFRDSDGTRYVVYKVDGNAKGNGGSCGNTVEPIHSTPIMIQQVQSDGVTKVGGPTQILDRGPSDGPLVEAPSLMKDSAGTYVLFFSSNCYTTTDYDVAYATSQSVNSGYVKGPALLTTNSNGLSGPGGATIATDGTHMAFHGQIGSDGRRAMYTATISVSGTTVTV